MDYELSEVVMPGHRLRAGMIGLGMIFNETYLPFFEAVCKTPLFDRRFGVCEVSLAAAASRTGRRVEELRRETKNTIGQFQSYHSETAVTDLLKSGVDFVCVATPDDRHFAAAQEVLRSGKHLLVEKPSVLRLDQLDSLNELARQNKVLAKVVYHKLLDTDHKMLRTMVLEGALQHVNNGYCSLLEPKSISSSQFAEWICGRNPGTYVAVHYIKLIDFTFGLKLKRVTCTGQRGLVGELHGNTWDSTQLRLVYSYDDGREAAFDIHTSWVLPNNFPGYVEQEVQFRFDNGVWNGHSRKRGVECTIENRTPFELKTTMNNHYNARTIEPWGGTVRRGYGVEVIERFAREVATVEYGGPANQRDQRLMTARELQYNDLDADRQVVAAVQAMEEILSQHAAGKPECVVHVNDPLGGLVLYRHPTREPDVLYRPTV